MNVIINIGIPGSGKSTWAKEFISKSDYYRINCDDIRLMLKNKPFLGDDESIVWAIFDQMLQTLLSQDRNIVIDNTNCNLKMLLKLINTLSTSRFKPAIVINVFNVELEVAIERDSKRENPVGDEVIKRMYDNFQITIKNEEVNRYILNKCYFN